ncbi:hypothetical protein JCM8547_002579 [Rhodosporidiobolus lusitaniae]
MASPPPPPPPFYPGTYGQLPNLSAAPLPSLPLAAPPPPAPPPAAPSTSTPRPPLVAPSTAASPAKKKPAAPKKKPAEEGPEGEPKPKKKRTSKKQGEVGPGKAWRKGVKGNLAGVGLNPDVGAAIHQAAATGTPVSLPPGTPVPGGSGTPVQTPGGGGGTPRPATTAAIGAPPKLGNQFLQINPLHLGTPRPRKWTRGRVVIKSVSGRAIGLPSWQGDDNSLFAFAVGSSAPASAQIDELASPPPGGYSPSLTPAPSSSKPRASAAVGGSHLMTPSSSQRGQHAPSPLSHQQQTPQPLPVHYAPPVLPPPPPASHSVTPAPPVFPPLPASTSQSGPPAQPASYHPPPPNLNGASIPYPTHSQVAFGGNPLAAPKEEGDDDGREEVKLAPPTLPPLPGMGGA